MKHQWQVVVRGEPADVSGFTRASKARHHVEKHFFNPNERWEQVAASPIALRNEFKAAAQESGRKSSPEAYKVLDTAWAQYETVIEKCTTGSEPVRVETYTHKPDEGGKPYFAISVVSRSGVFSAFRKSEVSELTTSFRPKVKAYQGPIRSRDYLNAALNKLNEKLSISKELFGD